MVIIRDSRLTLGLFLVSGGGIISSIFIHLPLGKRVINLFRIPKRERWVGYLLLFYLLFTGSDFTRLRFIILSFPGSDFVSSFCFVVSRERIISLVMNEIGRQSDIYNLQALEFLKERGRKREGSDR